MVIKKEVVKEVVSLRNKKEFTKIASQIFVKFRLIFRRSYFWNTVNQRL
ncbi:hypothetical protein HMPREF9522_00728 [Enterococcus faecium TX0082]|nr:hypothetical protein HMPREF9522_00728 [Enterococcus faecium TX0082]